MLAGRVDSRRRRRRRLFPLPCPPPPSPPTPIPWTIAIRLASVAVSPALPSRPAIASSRQPQPTSGRYNTTTTTAYSQWQQQLYGVRTHRYVATVSTTHQHYVQLKELLYTARRRRAVLLPVSAGAMVYNTVSTQKQRSCSSKTSYNELICGRITQ